MTQITGYVVDAIRTSTHISSVGYTYVSGAIVYVDAATSGTVYDTTYGSGYFNVSGAVSGVSVVTVSAKRFQTETILISGTDRITLWRNRSYM